MYIYVSLASLYAAVVIPGLTVYAASPLFYELSCEASYPTGEGITTLVLTDFNNIIGIIFLAVLDIPNLGQSSVLFCNIYFNDIYDDLVPTSSNMSGCVYLCACLYQRVTLATRLTSLGM